MQLKCPELEALGNDFEFGVVLPKHKYKWTQGENRMLWKFYFESDKNVKGNMGRMHRLWIERGDRDMSEHRLSAKH